MNCECNAFLQEKRRFDLGWVVNFFTLNLKTQRRSDLRHHRCRARLEHREKRLAQI
jgi:hypothetical protein